MQQFGVLLFLIDALSPVVLVASDSMARVGVGVGGVEEGRGVVSIDSIVGGEKLVVDDARAYSSSSNHCTTRIRSNRRPCSHGRRWVHCC